MIQCQALGNMVYTLYAIYLNNLKRKVLLLSSFFLETEAERLHKSLKATQIEDGSVSTPISLLNLKTQLLALALLEATELNGYLRRCQLHGPENYRRKNNWVRFTAV